MNRKYTPLEAWISSVLSDPDMPERVTVLAVLYKRPDGGGGTREVKAIKIEGKTHDPADLARLITGLVETYAQELGGISQFEIQALYGKGNIGAHHTISVMDGELQQGGRGRSVKEANDGPGLVAQAMRHTEKAFELLATLVQHGAVTTLSREQAAAERESALRIEVADAYKIVRESMLANQKENHEMRMRQLEFERNSSERKQVFALGPALLNTVAGREIFPQSTADTALIERLAEEVSPDMIRQLADMGVLKNELMGPLMARFNEVLTKKKAEAEAVKQLPPSDTNPREDAAGGSTH
jgi:hypothetical protein